MKCSFPAGRTVWMVPKVVGMSSVEPIRILKLLKRVMMTKHVVDIPRILRRGENRAGCDQVRMLVNDELQSLRHPQAGLETPGVLACDESGALEV